MNLSKYYGKNILPSCAYCFYKGVSGEKASCEKNRLPSDGRACSAFRYEPTLREPKEAPSPGHFKPEDFQI